MSYYNKDPKSDPNIDNHPYRIYRDPRCDCKDGPRGLAREVGGGMAAKPRDSLFTVTGEAYRIQGLGFKGGSKAVRGISGLCVRMRRPVTLRPNPNEVPKILKTKTW